MPFVGITDYAIIRPSTWESAKRIGTHLDTFVFRGQNNAHWNLETTLIRSIKKNNPNYLKYTSARHEQQVINVFKARAHNYLQSAPEFQENIEWLSIIQDFGGPTRLLDFTYSFYIASFFALEEAEGNCAIWCINSDLLDMQAQSRGINNFEEFTKKAISHPLGQKNLVLWITPPRLNQRLAIQKGTFLTPLNIDSTFEENLCETFEFPFNNLAEENAVVVDEKLKLNEFRKHCIVKIILPRNIRTKAIEDLYSMNIDSASLFPDLSGFARSLKFQTRSYETRGQSGSTEDES